MDLHILKYLRKKSHIFQYVYSMKCVKIPLPNDCYLFERLIFRKHTICDIFEQKCRDYSVQL